MDPLNTTTPNLRCLEAAVEGKEFANPPVKLYLADARGGNRGSSMLL